MIEIINYELIENIWACWLQLTQGEESWVLPTTAPGTLVEVDLQAYFDARETELWILAQAKQYSVDLYKYIPLRRLLKAFALVMLDEINLLRQQHNLPERIPSQIVTAIKTKLR